MAAAPPSVSVVIPARDAEATLPATLDALARQSTRVAFEVIVVDDGSTDGTLSVVRASPLEVRLVHGTGRGAGAARNAGAAQARGEVLAFTDADCAPTPGWLEAGLAALASADLVQGAVLPTPGTSVGPWDRTLAVVSEYGLYETANLIVHRAWFERVGGFTDWVDGRFGRPFGEDAWFAWRAKRAGARSAFAPDALVHHAVFPGQWRAVVAERARDRFFPPLVVRIPELRDAFLHRRWFLSPRSAAFDLAGVGVALALARRSPWPLLAAVPYARRVASDTRRWDRARRPKVALAGVAGDVVSCAALVRGSIEARAPVL